jgi:release factor glutamine methyltransferase
MSINDWLKYAEAFLKEKGIRTSRLDSILILEHVAGRDRSWLLANPDSIIDPALMQKLKNLLIKRSAHVPISYLLGKSEFYGREFVLNEAVLEPRPESEAMIDMLKHIALSMVKQPSKGLLSKNKLFIADVGTGSGALGITAALELPGSEIVLIDIDDEVLKTAKINVDLFTLNISLIKSDLLSKAPGPYDILLCNLPYVPDDYKINLAAGHEPKIAIFGGKDGLNLYRKLFKQASLLNHRPLYILCESLPFQHEDLKQIAESSSYILEKTDDFIQSFRLSRN